MATLASPAAFLRLGVPGEALVLAAIDAGRLEAALGVARIMRRIGEPAAALYEAALLFEAGDEAGARRVAAASAAPLTSRGPGARLRRALAARDAGARTLVYDDAGALVATTDAEGRLSAEPDSDAVLETILPRVASVAAALALRPAMDGELSRPAQDARAEVRALRLGMDAELSRLALEALAGARGSIVLVDARTGAVRAAVSDARTAATERGAAFSQRREPASVAKLITAAAAYRAGRDPDAAIARMTCTGVERYAGQPLWCPSPAGALGGLDRALAWSCNVAFANVAVDLGRERLEDEYRRWGFDRPAEQLLGEAGRIHTPPRTARQLADLAVGLENVDVTPIHAALLAAIVANDGRLAEPRLVEGECGGLGLVRRPAANGAGAGAASSPVPATDQGAGRSADHSARAEQPVAHAAPIAVAEAGPPAGADSGRGRETVLDPAVARRLARAMRAVTSYGTGAGLAPPGVAVAMKTGTAAEFRKGYHVNYVGWLEHESLAFCVRVTHERSSPAVTRRAREVTARLLAGVSQHLARRGAHHPQR